MRTLTKVGSVVACLFASLFITWFAWQILVEGRAFHCTDEGTLSLGFWMSVDSHQSAGDRILPGWSWENVALARRVYQLAFLGLWFAGSAFTFGVFRRDKNAG